MPPATCSARHTAAGRANGTVFEIAKTNGGYASTPTTLVSFNGADGGGPQAGLIIDAEGDLFGTTSSGGANSDGTVFEVTAPPAPAGLTLAPASDSGVQGDDITNVTTPAITGTGAAGDTVTLYNGGTLLGTAMVGTGGTWSITSSTLAAGSYSLTATQTDVAGNVSAASAALALTIKTTAAAPTGLILAPASDSGVKGDDITNVTTPMITGHGATPVNLYSGSTLLGTATVDLAGTWSITSSTLAAGSYSVTATETDAAGNVSGPSAALALTIETTAPVPTGLTLAPASDSGAKGDDITNATTPAITGTGAAGDTVTLYSGGTLLGTAMVGTGGIWSITSSTLAAGIYSLTATQTDVAGNVSAASAALGLTDIAKVTVTGTAVNNSTVALSDNGTVVGTVTANGTGAWSIANVVLAQGANPLRATATDAAGNTSASSSFTATLDTTPPVVTVTSPGGVVHATPQTVSGTVDVADAGTIVTIAEAGATLGSATVGANGQWSVAVTLAGIGSNALTASDTDAAGLHAPARGAVRFQRYRHRCRAVAKQHQWAGNRMADSRRRLREERRFWAGRQRLAPGLPRRLQR